MEGERLAHKPFIALSGAAGNKRRSFAFQMRNVEMVRLWRLIAAFVLVASATQAQVLDDSTSFEHLIHRSALVRKNVLLVFDCPSCVICKVLQREFFADSAIRNLLRQRFLVRVVSSTVRGGATETIYESTPNGAIAQKFQVAGFPTLIILRGSADGRYSVIKAWRGVEFESQGSGMLVFIKHGKAHFDLKDAYERFSNLSYYE